METKKYKVMLAVDDNGSFTRVAEELGYTQSGITQMMKSLEKEVGLPLFVKHNHGVSLTKEAKALIPSIRAMINASEVVNQEIASMKGAQVGTITIGTFLSCSIHWIPKIICDFQKDHPDIHFKIIEGLESELPLWIQEHRVDIGFLSKQEKESYQFFPVMDDPFYVVLPKDHEYIRYDEIPIELIDKVPFITADYKPNSDIHRIFEQYHLRPHIQHNTINEFSALSMVEHNLGITIMPGLLLRGMSGDFVTRPIKPNVSRRLGLAYSSEEDLSPATKIFLKYARDFLFDD